MRKNKEPSRAIPYGHKKVPLSAAYASFVSKFPNSSITLDKFKEVIVTFNDAMIEGLITNRDGVSLPANLGTLFIGTCETRCRSVNLKASTPNNNVYYKNWDTDNKLMKIFYTNSHTSRQFQNNELWAFHLCRHFRRRISERYVKNWTFYINIAKGLKIETLFRKTMPVTRDKRIFRAEAPAEYDEFKM